MIEEYGSSPPLRMGQDIQMESVEGVLSKQSADGNLWIGSLRAIPSVCARNIVRRSPHSRSWI